MSNQAVHYHCQNHRDKAMFELLILAYIVSFKFFISSKVSTDGPVSVSNIPQVMSGTLNPLTHALRTESVGASLYKSSFKTASRLRGPIQAYF